MIAELKQMIEINRAILDASEKSDIDRVVVLLKRRKEVTENMPKLDPKDPEVSSGKVADLLKEIVEMDGHIEGKIMSIMGNLQDAINAVKGEQQIMKGYVAPQEEREPKYIDREG